jgi:ribosomal protein L37AE/L43A
MKPCPKCNNTQFVNMPDSLAWACNKCGFVWVGFDDEDMVPGATIQEWLKDVYNIKQDKETHGF